MHLRIIITLIISFIYLEGFTTERTIAGGHYRNFYVASGDKVIVNGDLTIEGSHGHFQSFYSNGKPHQDFIIENKGTLIIHGTLTINGYVTYVSKHGPPSNNYKKLPFHVDGDLLVENNLQTKGAVNYHSGPNSNLIVLGNIISSNNIFGGRHGWASIDNKVGGSNNGNSYYGPSTQVKELFFNKNHVVKITPDNVNQVPPNIQQLIQTHAPNSMAGIALPVELSYFKTKVEENNVILEWETATEINSKSFKITRSYDGKKFKNVTVIKAAGNSDTSIKYNYTDKNVKFGTATYRLIETDLDGKEQSWSQIIHISSHINDERILNVYPVPCADVLHIEIDDLAENEQMDVELVHISTGQKIPVTHERESNEYHKQLNVRELENGIYVLLVNEDGKSIFKKEVIIQH
ncbi:hypothetical protein MY04_3947 [Flammeovirga sp. MY04]|uniref:T9SS type A sorting domain-containing protein n=1 Tax=Flammeovirga sp. MY04 TaxID=1191459 RepID=UPI00080626EE|nr:T9SS type A sorting domain-containing protein [Flammeovirga sp. MY04]ANQ51291.1 hypothetical protein MY04_3947 [Flammeovirga sp. MY04]